MYNLKKKCNKTNNNNKLTFIKIKKNNNKRWRQSKHTEQNLIWMKTKCRQIVWIIKTTKLNEESRSYMYPKSPQVVSRTSQAKLLHIQNLKSAYRCLLLRKFIMQTIGDFLVFYKCDNFGCGLMPSQKQTPLDSVIYGTFRISTSAPAFDYKS